jgi:hypothetical protein
MTRATRTRIADTSPVLNTERTQTRTRASDTNRPKFQHWTFKIHANSRLSVH